MATDDHVLELLDGYLYGTLAESEMRRVARHTTDCKICRTAPDEAERCKAAVENIPPSEASEALIRKTLEKVAMASIAREQKWRRFRQVVSLATAAAVLLIASVHIYYFKLAPSSTDLRILGQNELLAGTPASLRLAVFDVRTNQPLPRVPLTVALYNSESRETVELAQLTTDDRGNANPQFELPDWPEGKYELRVVAGTGDGEAIERQVELKRAWQLMLSTDKPVYQPGQVLHLRTLALRRPDLKPVAGEELLFTITDPAGNVIFKQRDLTSRFGLASADCQFAGEIIEGGYQV